MNITAFCCHNSLYGAGESAPAEKAGADGVHKIEVPCSSRVDPIHILKAFENGADGVVVIACPEDACRMLKGSRLAGKRAAFTKQLLEEAGLNPDRLMLFRPDVPSAPELSRIVGEARDALEKLKLSSPA